MYFFSDCRLMSVTRMRALIILPTVYLFILSLVSTVPVNSIAICSEKIGGGFVHRWFDPAYKICCGERLSQRTANSECCNAETIYYSDKQICCNGQISNKTVSVLTKKWEPYCEQDNPNCVELTCCGNELIMGKDDVYCCSGTAIKLSKDQVENKYFLRCCDKKAYNAVNELCCQGSVLKNDKVVGCCNGQVYLTKNYKCIQGRKMKIDEGLCGSTIYNRLESTCCNDQLIKDVPEMKEAKNGTRFLNPDARCCGSFIINKNQSCCERRHHGYQTHSIPKQNDLMCCGKRYYNATAQLCISGIPVDKSPYDIQCGNQSIDSRVQSCCANKFPYNSTSEECCEGAHYCVIKKGEKCCNGIHMKSNEFCCENIKPCAKKNEEDDECCFDYEKNDGQTYKKGQWTCYYGHLAKVPKGQLLCGPNEYYNPDEHYCCNEKKYKHGSGQCCGGVYSNIPPEEGRCCLYTNKVYKFDDETNPCMDKCNGKQMYDIFNELCCRGKIYNKSKCDGCRTMACCGNGFPYRQGGSKDCCHDTQLYNVKYSTCNEDGTVEYKGDFKNLSGGERLCHASIVRLFDGGIQHACISKHVIAGKIDSVRYTKQGDNIQLTIELKRVKTLTEKKLPKRITFNILISDAKCKIDHLKKVKRVIVLFDHAVKGRNVTILKDSPFFFARKTYHRYQSVKNALTSSVCHKFL